MKDLTRQAPVLLRPGALIDLRSPQRALLPLVNADRSPGTESGMRKQNVPNAECVSVWQS